MISIPEAVKEALRDGRMRKNYKIGIDGKFESDISYDDVTLPFEIRHSAYEWVDIKTTNKHIITANNVPLKHTVVPDPDFPVDYYEGAIINDIHGVRIEPTIIEPLGEDFYNLTWICNFNEGDRICFYYENSSRSEYQGIWPEYITYEISDGDKADEISNDKLIKESVKFDERMCTGDRLKFGLCEGSVIEFQYFDHENIRNKRIKVIVDVEYYYDEQERKENIKRWYSIPIGWFDVKECPRQASTGIYKATAINKLKSDYLNNKANEMAKSGYTDINTPVTVYDLKKMLLNNYTIIPRPTPIHAYSEGGIVYHRYSRAEAFRFKRVYGVDSPINGRMYYEAGAGTPVPANTYYGSVLSVSIGSYPYTYRLSDCRYYDFVVLHNVLTEFEKIYKNYLIKLFGDAELVATGDYSCEVLTGEQVLDILTTDQGDSEYYLGGQFYVQVSMSRVEGGTVVFYNEYYSTMQYEYEKKAGYPISVKGTLSDFFYRLFDTDLENFSGSITIYVPSLWTVNYLPWTEGGVADFISIESDFSYSYYTNVALTEYEQSSLQRMMNSDGTPYERSNILDVYKMDGYISPAELVKISLTDAADYTLRDLLTASFETQCQYGKLDRETDLFSGVELNNSRLLPADTLYPANDLYPNGMSEHPMKSQYSKLWADSAGVQKFRYLIITYKTLEGEQGQEQEVEKTLQRTVNNDGNVLITT